MEDMPLCLARWECVGGISCCSLYKAGHVDPQGGLTYLLHLAWECWAQVGGSAQMSCSCRSDQPASTGVSISGLFQLSDLTVPSCPEIQRPHVVTSLDLAMGYRSADLGHPQGIWVLEWP